MFVDSFKAKNFDFSLEDSFIKYKQVYIIIKKSR